MITVTNLADVIEVGKITGSYAQSSPDGTRCDGWVDKPDFKSASAKPANDFGG